MQGYGRVPFRFRGKHENSISTSPLLLFRVAGQACAARMWARCKDMGSVRMIPSFFVPQPLRWVASRDFAGAASERARYIPQPRRARRLHLRFPVLPFPAVSQACVWGIRGRCDTRRAKAFPGGEAFKLGAHRAPRLRRDPTKWSRRIRKNGEADSVQTDSLHSASRASRKAPHPLLRFSSQNRNDVSVLKGRAAKRTSPRVYTGAASEAARCAPFLRQARKLRICSRLLPDPPESLRWIPSEMRGRERARSDVLTSPL